MGLIPTIPLELSLVHSRGSSMGGTAAPGLGAEDTVSQGSQSSKSLPCHCPDPKGLPCGLGLPVPKEDALVRTPHVCVCVSPCEQRRRESWICGMQGNLGRGVSLGGVHGDFQRSLCSWMWFGVSMGPWGIWEVSVSLQGGLRGARCV